MKNNGAKNKLPHAPLRFLIYFGATCIVTSVVVVAVNKNRFFHIELPALTNKQFSKKATQFQYADPYSTMKALKEGNKEKIMLVDMRSKKDYSSMRYKNTVNIPYPYEKNKAEEKNFVDAVNKQVKRYDKVVLLPYSSASTSGEDALRALTNAGISKALIMRIGWNEMYSLPNLWIPEEKLGELVISDLLEN